MKWPRRLSYSALLLATTVAAAQLAGAQSPERIDATPRVEYRPLAADRGASALWQSLEKLHTRASLMMVTAHPDDEDGGMLA
jgi:hypothetical protein